MKLRFVKQNYQKALILLRAKLNISQHELADLLRFHIIPFPDGKTGTLNLQRLQKLG